jgi:hypothetical protein
MRNTTSDMKLNWRPDGDGGFGLYWGRRIVPTLRVVPDAKYSGMWRVQWPDGRLSDMCNLSRAKDAASLIALRLYAESASEAPPVRQKREAATLHAL